MEELLATTSPLALAVTSATGGRTSDLQQHLTSFAATVTVFRPPGPNEIASSTVAAQTLDDAVVPVVHHVLTVPKAALRSGQCGSLDAIRDCLTSAAWSTIQESNEQLYQAACDGQQAQSFLWLSLQGLQATRTSLIRAAKAGLLEVLQAHSRDGPCFDAEFLQAAAHSEAADCLSYLHQTCGLALPVDTCLTACRAGSVACLRYANSKGCELAAPLILAALRNHGTRENQYKCGRCVRWLLAHRCPMPSKLEPMDLYIIGVKQQMVKERRTAAMAVLRHPALSQLPALPLACCELVLQSADLWIPPLSCPQKQRKSGRKPAKRKQPDTMHD